MNITADMALLPPLEELSDSLAASLPDANAGSDSVPPSDEPSDLPWLPDTDASRWVDFNADAQGDQWGSEQASARQPDFDPASAFEATSSAGNDSLTDKEESQWEETASGSDTKRQRLNAGGFKREGTSSPHSQNTSPIRQRLDRRDSGSKTEIVNTQDDDDKSSGDFQGPDLEENEEDVIKALGTENVRRLASMTDGDLADFEESSSISSSKANHLSSETSSDVSSEDLPRGTFCVNCTGMVFSGQEECQECGHKPDQDSRLFSRVMPLHDEDNESDENITALAYDEAMLEHEEGKQMPHPERPDRIRAIIARLMATGLSERCRRIKCREATLSELAACHSLKHIESVAAKAAEAKASGEEIGVPRVYYSMDTYVRPNTFHCASLSAGGAIEAACMVARGQCRNSAAIIRPPGHHAESNMAMGFCFFNNAAVAARAAQAAGAERVMILDWDVHHGNGTQHIFEEDPSVLYVSLHRYDGGHFFPGTGAPGEVGIGAGAGKSVNVPWPTGGMGNGDYIAAFHRLVMPITYEFQPDLIIISAGFDAAKGDPLGGCRLTPECFAHMTAMLKAAAPCCALLEGGYNLEATADGTEATLRVLMGEAPPPLPSAARISPMASLAIQTVTQRQAPFWRCLRAFSEHHLFDPYSSAFLRSAGEVASPKALAEEDQVLSPRKSGPEADRSKLAAVRQQGKSQRKLAFMHALHLVAVKHRMRISRDVQKSLARSTQLQGHTNDQLNPMRGLQHIRTKPSLTAASPLSPTKRSLSRLGSHHPVSPLDEDPFMTQDSDTDRKPVEQGRTLSGLAD